MSDEAKRGQGRGRGDEVCEYDLGAPACTRGRFCREPPDDAVSLRALEIVQTMRVGAGGVAAADGSLLGLFLSGAGTSGRG